LFRPRKWAQQLASTQNDLALPAISQPEENIMPRMPDLIHRASRQVLKATARGDLDAAFKWTFILDRQLDIIGRLVCLDENDRRLRRYRGAIACLRQAMLALQRLAPERGEPVEKRPPTCQSTCTR
jgi:hypothetical protein